MSEFLIPKKGTLERLLFEKLVDSGDDGVTYLDFVGTGITEDNIDELIENLKTGMFDAENDDEIRFDS